jgi:hypothetical protein
MIANLTAIMDGLADLATSAGLVENAYAWPADSIAVPCIVVGYPTRTTFDITYQRGGDEMTFPVWAVVGKTTTKDARDRLSTLLGDVSSVKSAFDGLRSFGDVRVTNASIDEIAVGGITYLAALFEVEVI